MKSTAADRLAQEAYLSLITFRRDGSPVATPIWAAAVEQRLYVVTDGTSWKVKRLARNPRIRLAPCNAWGGVTGEWIDGRGRALADEAMIRRANEALLGKYGIQFRLLNLFSWLGGRIGRRAILELEVEGRE